MKKNKKDVDQQLVFYLCKYGISYNTNVKEYAHLYGQYIRIAVDSVAKIKDKYFEAGSAVGIKNKVIPYGSKIIDETVELMIKDLYSRGITISLSDFKAKYGGLPYFDNNNDFGYLGQCKIVNRLLDDTNVLAEKLEYAEAKRKAARPHWQGGGFGVKGALKGAATAAALNVGTDFLRSFGDASRASKNNKIVDESRQRIYNASNVHYAVCDYVGVAIMNAFESYAEILEQRCDIKRIHLDQQKAEGMYKNLMKYAGEDNDRFQNELVDCIKLNPSEKKYYDALLPYVFQNIKDDLEDFLEFWNIEFILPDYKEGRIIGKRFDNEWLASECGNVFVPNWSFYVKTKQFYIDFCKKNDIYRLPPYSLFGFALKDYYRDINRGVVSGEELWMFSYFEMIEWIPEELSFDEFVEYLSFERDSLYSCYGDVWLKCDEIFDEDDEADDEIYQIPLVKFAKKYAIGITDMYIYYETKIGMFGGSSGLLITNKEVIDTKTERRILMSDIKNIGLIEGEKHPVYVNDGKNEIYLEYSEGIPELAAWYIANLLRVIAVRYGGNTVLPTVFKKMKSKPQNSNVNISKMKEPCGKDKAVAINVDAPKEENESKGNVNDTMFCPFCGEKISRKAKFCNYCGKENNYTK